MVAGDPNRGYWYAYTSDSLLYNHPVIDTVRVTAVSLNPTVVAVDSALGKVLPNNGSVTVNYSLRALPGAGGDSARIVMTAPNYTPDTTMVYVQRPTLSYSYYGYPYGRIPHGTLHDNAAYFQIPYARTDTFWVVLSHTRRGIVGGPDSVAFLPGTTTQYIDLRGDSLGIDTIGVARATGYVVSGAPLEFRVDRPRVQLYNYPTTLYTISAPTYVTAAVVDSLTGYAHNLLAPLTVSLAVRNTAVVTLD